MPSSGASLTTVPAAGGPDETSTSQLSCWRLNGSRNPDHSSIGFLRFIFTSPLALHLVTTSMLMPMVCQLPRDKLSPKGALGSRAFPVDAKQPGALRFCKGRLGAGQFYANR